MTWKELWKQCEKLQQAVEARPGQGNVAHNARLRLMNALAEAGEILEAFAEDEREKP